MATDIVLCMKINEKQWVEAIRDGSLCFNRAGYFIEQAEEKGNNEQGDKYEGVFARIKKLMEESLIFAINMLMI